MSVINGLTELKSDKKAVLFGNTKHTTSHDGTRKFVRRIGYYARQYNDYSEQLGSTIYSEFEKKGYRFWIPMEDDDDHFRVATIAEALKRIKLVFKNGGGKAAGRRKNVSRSAKNNTCSDDPDSPPYQKGDSIYAFEQLYRATVLDVEPTLDGYDVEVHWKGFQHKDNSVISSLQILPSTKKTRELYETIDKSEWVHSDDDVPDHQLILGNPKRRRIMQTPYVTTPLVAVAATSETASATAVTPPPSDTAAVLPLGETIQLAKSKCDKIVNEANASEDMNQLKKGLFAERTKKMIEKVEQDIPTRAHLQLLGSQGLASKLEASVTSSMIETMEREEKHLVAFINGLTKDL